MKDQASIFKKMLSRSNKKFDFKSYRLENINYLLLLLFDARAFIIIGRLEHPCSCNQHYHFLMLEPSLLLQSSNIIIYYYQLMLEPSLLLEGKARASMLMQSTLSFFDARAFIFIAKLEHHHLLLLVDARAFIIIGRLEHPCSCNRPYYFLMLEPSL